LTHRLINEYSLHHGLFCDPGLSYDHNIYGSDTYSLDNKVVVGGGNTYLVQWSQRRSGGMVLPRGKIGPESVWDIIETYKPHCVLRSRRSAESVWNTGSASIRNALRLNCKPVV